MKISEPKKTKTNRAKCWEVKILHGKRGAGSKRARLYFLTQQAARAERSRMLAAVEAGQFSTVFPELAARLGFVQVSEGNVRWVSAVPRWLEAQERRGLRAATLKGYEGNVLRCGKFLGNPVLANVTPGMVVDFIVARGATEKSRRSLRGAVGSFLKWAGSMGLVDKRRFSGELVWEKVKTDKIKPAFLDAEEVERLFEFAVVFARGSNGRGLRVDVAKSLRFRAALGCALFLGIRPGLVVKGSSRAGELPLIRRRDFDLEAAELLVRPDVAKTRVERLVYDVPPNLLEAVGVAGYAPDDYILPGGYSWFRRHIDLTRARVEAEGLPALTWCQKILRHTFGSMGVHRTFSREWVTQAGGWEDPRILSSHYVGNAKPEEAARFWAFEFADIPDRWRSPEVDKAAAGLRRGFLLKRGKKKRLPITEFLREDVLGDLDGLVQSMGFSRSVVLERAITELKRSHD